MKLLIEDWGPIVSAEIDLTKRLIVFTGPNGTGKTYISYLLYGLMSSIGAKPYSNIQNHDDDRYYAIFHGEDLERGLPVQIEIDPAQIFELFTDMLSNKGGNLLDYIDVDVISPDLSIKITSSLEDWSKWLYDSEIDFGGDLSVVKKSHSYSFSLTPKSDVKINVPFQIAYLFHRLFLQDVSIPYMLTAERTGIYTFSKEISLGRLRDPKIASRYPKPISDGLVNAEDLANAKKNKSDYSKLADDIESDILQGKMVITDDGEIQYHHNNAVLSYNLSSTMVKTLSPIIFYLRYKAEKDILLIIDEPEINLHPSNQILLARVFARMINAGLHLMIATHSDYIIREINNLIMGEALQRKGNNIKIKEEYNFAQDELVKASDVSAFSFNPCSEGKVNVEKLEVNDFGFDVKSINVAIEAQNSITNEIFDRLAYEITDNGDE